VIFKPNTSKESKYAFIFISRYSIFGQEYPDGTSSSPISPNKPSNALSHRVISCYAARNTRLKKIIETICTVDLQMTARDISDHI
jgi:hypothetical protein